MTHRETTSENTAHRIDPAHAIAGEQVDLSGVANLEVQRPAAQLIAAAAGVDDDGAEEPFELQGHQLAMALVTRQRDIDRRESQFNAYLATLENESRGVRLKLHERDSDLSSREEEYAARLAQLAEREAATPAGERWPSLNSGDDAQLRKKSHEMNERQLRLEAEENRLRHQWQQIHTGREASMQLVRHLMRSVERRREAVEQQLVDAPAAATKKTTAPDLQRFATELDERHQALTTAQQEVDLQTKSLFAERRKLDQQREQWEQSRRREQARFSEQQEQAKSEHDERQQSLQRRTDDLAKRQTALDQMQASVTHAHREALELRLATEQLWSQLGEKVSPAELAETLGGLRAKLAEHYRTAEDSLARQREELHEMAARLDEQQRRLRTEREEQQQWLARRHEEIEFQAARLVAREQELESQQAKHESAREQWEQQRHEYEDEIRRLQAQCKRPSEPLLTAGLF